MMGEVSKKYDWRNDQKITKKRYMLFCHSLNSFVSKVVSIIRNRITREEKIGKVASRRKKKKRRYKGEVH